MKNKLLIELVVPELDEVFDIYIPINRKIGNVIGLLNKSLFEFTNGAFQGNERTMLYDRESGEMYHVNTLVRETNIKNGSRVILL